MVCDRCIMVVQQQLEQRGFAVKHIALGEVEVSPVPDEAQLLEISQALNVLGFELIDKQKDQVVEQIRSIIINTIHHEDSTTLNINYSDLLAQRLHKDYSYLSRLFSAQENRTIEKFVIQQKVEKIKELLQYEELNISEIAFKMGYSSSAHLSTQFKNVVGMSPTAYKQLQQTSRQPLDKV